MNSNDKVKEELLTMLSEICGQLDELEGLLEKNAARTRKKLMNKQAEKMISCYGKMNDLEEKLIKDTSAQGTYTNTRSLKLELGY
ncbi:hypothetical protein ACQCT6_17920 [Cytobacillus gottheilii]|uniref:Uncharacterized protein n=1 Tax=Cytobacillus gottheilii TaxID=859144 RepID=A0ABX8FAG7_9BACI|nr:hypothetical protein [Cytobacillus gottheilii]QVY60132.1 hypothetical protein J1899_13965 [Cytobacillus gottheilii]